jgi:cellulose synthase operon protein C
LAEQYLRKSLDSAQDKSNARWTLADFYLRHGAESKAEVLLAELISPQSQAPKTVVRSARRGMAMIWSRRKEYRKFLQALSLIDQNLQQFEELTAEDLSIKARVLASRQIRRHQLEAIRIYGNLSDQTELSAIDQFRLSRLHLAVGNRKSAIKIMRTLATDIDPRNAEFRYAYARMLLDGGEISEAAEQVKQLAVLDPTRFRTVKLQAEILVAQDKIDESIALLNERFKQADIDAKRIEIEKGIGASLLAALARKLDHSGRKSAAAKLSHEAEKILQVISASDPRWLLEYARLMGNRKQLDAALDLCEKAWGLLPGKDVAILCHRLLVTGRPQEKQINRVKNWLKAAHNKQPDVPEYIFQLANVAGIERDYPAAERYYRQALKAQPNSIWSRNELALLLALREGNGKEALAMINQAIDIAGPIPHLLDTRATILLSMDQPQQAVNDSLIAVESLSDMPVVFFHLSQGHLAANDRSSAQVAFHQAVAAGLHVKSLHPLERDNYIKVRDLFQKQ